MAFANKKQETPTPASSGGQPQQIHVDRNAVNVASRSTSGIINKMAEQIYRETTRELEKKHK